VLSPIAGRIASRVGARPMLVAGSLLLATGYGLLANLSQVGGYWTSVFPGLVLLALGSGIAVAPLTDAVLGAVDDEFEGAAAGVNNAVAAGYRMAMMAACVATLGAAAVAAVTVRKRKP
jgi:MFS family permease